MPAVSGSSRSKVTVFQPMCGTFSDGSIWKRRTCPLKTPKAGVYAVRQGPFLTHNLRALLVGEPLRNYVPQKDFLTLLNLEEGTARGDKWGVACQGKGVLWLKDIIDRRFMTRFQE